MNATIPDLNALPARYATNQAPNRARAVKTEAGGPVNELHDFALARLAEIQIPANVHFREEGSRQLAAQVAAAIRTSLPARTR